MKNRWIRLRHGHCANICWVKVQIDLKFPFTICPTSEKVFIGHNDVCPTAIMSFMSVSFQGTVIIVYCLCRHHEIT